ncbi:MAG: SDR family NAD(P)-dependent oxidoreductase, partial [Saprospiraceae bacterium]|nr:SDR family NAD(P)-dependent oxidoreductase [Saprospiraceae bacterium]
MTLKGKTALITGGTKGIGLGIAHAMMQNGMNVVITGRTQESVNNVVKELDAVYPGQIAGHSGNVVRMEDMSSCMNTLHKNFGDLDVLVANAGVGHFATIEDMEPEQWNEVIDVNLTGVFNSVKVAVPDLKKTKGYIMTIASLAGTNFFARGAAYNASKFGL